jgi:hypothetical protein
VALTAIALVAPALIGIFWGAPLVARELETGTFRLGWTQSVTRRRWLAVKIGVVGVASVAVAALVTLMVTWWSSPIVAANANRFGIGLFGLLGITPIGYAAFAFALGLTVGVLLRRTVPAMATTLVGFVAVRLAVTYWVRPYLLSPVHTVQAFRSNNVGISLRPSGPTVIAQNVTIPNAWVYSSTLANHAGQAPTSQFLKTACPNIASGLANPSFRHPSGKGAIAVEAPTRDAFQSCIAKVAANFHEVVTYQPASRYWALQGLETAVFIVLALILGGVCFWWVRHRLS